MGRGEVPKRRRDIGVIGESSDRRVIHRKIRNRGEKEFMRCETLNPETSMSGLITVTRWRSHGPRHNRGVKAKKTHRKIRIREIGDSVVKSFGTFRFVKPRTLIREKAGVTIQWSHGVEPIERANV